MGLAIFDQLPLPDGLDDMTLGDAAGQWFRDIVRAAFGSWDPATRQRSIRDILTLAPKSSSKTTYSAGLMLAVMLMNKRRNAEALFIGPTQTISDRAYDQAAAMIGRSKALQQRFKASDYNKTILDLVTNSEMKVKTFDLSILTGSILIFALLDELHILGRNQHTTKVLRQIRGGLDKTPEGLLLITTTQSDAIPVGAFREELYMARKIRDGKYKDKIIRPMLPVLYEFPDDIAKDRALWSNPKNWPMVMPNLGRSAHLDSLIPDWNSEQEKGDHAVRIWASQHLNIEMGVGMRSEGWGGAAFWEQNAAPAMSLADLISLCEVIVAGVDGGGLDDLLSVSFIGRKKGSREWLHWSRTWAHEVVLERRKGEAAVLNDFAKSKGRDLIIVADMKDAFGQVADLVAEVEATGLLDKIGFDPIGVGLIVDALAAKGIEGDDKIVAVSQGYKLQGAIKTAEVKLASGELTHSGQPIMAWAVENAKVEAKGNAIVITKQQAGSAKIDPLMAMFDAVALMSTNPESRGGSYLGSAKRLVMLD